MALLKDLIVQGASRFISDAYFATIKSGTWNGSTISVPYGGTGATSFTSGNALIGAGTGAITTKAVATANTASAIVARDASGNFSAGTITATLSGTATYASYVGTSSSNVSASNLVSMYNWYSTVNGTDADETDTAINRWNEITAFLAGITDSSTLTGILAGYLPLSGGTLTGDLTVGSTSANKTLTVHGTTTFETTTWGTQLEIWRRYDGGNPTIAYFEGTDKALIGYIGFANSTSTTRAPGKPYWHDGTTGYQLVYSTAKTTVGGTSTPIYIDANGQAQAGTALGGASTHAHTDYVTSVTYDSTNKKLQQSKGGGTATDIVTFGSNAFNSTAYLPLSNTAEKIINFTVTDYSSMLTINRVSGGSYSMIKYTVEGTLQGYIGFTAANTPSYINTSGTVYTLYHTGNLSPLTTSNYSSYAVPLSGGTMTGALTTPSLTVTGASSFSQAINGSILGNAATASRLQNARTITIGSKSNTFDGSSDISFTLSQIGAKHLQTAVATIGASSNTLTFINSISQDTNGVITATTGVVRDASASVVGVVNTTTQSFAGTKTFTGNVVIGSTSTNATLEVHGTTTLESTSLGTQLEIWRRTDNSSCVIAYYNGTSKTLLGHIGIANKQSSSIALGKPYWSDGAVAYQLVHSTAKTSVGGTTTPVYIDSNGQVQAGTALGTMAYDSTSNYVTIATEQTISGNKTFSSSVSIDDLTAGNLVVTGGASFAQTINGSVSGSAGSVAWDNVTSKPATATRWPTYAEVTSKPVRLDEYITSNDLATSTYNGFGRIQSSSPFTVINSSNTDCMTVNVAYSAQWAGQIAADYRSNNLAYRNKNNGTWNSWAIMLTDKNYFEMGVVTKAAANYSLSSGEWVDAGITFPTTAGSYLLTLISENLTATGVFSVGTSDGIKDEIALHLHGPNTYRLYARTDGAKLYLASSDSTQTSRSVTIKYKRLI